jgi:hypothetical protein
MSFSFSGGRIYDPNGQLFIPRGANVFPFDEINDKAETFHDEFYNKWGLNTIRLVHYPLINPVSGPQGLTQAELQEKLDYMVPTFTNRSDGKNIVIILDLAHDNLARENPPVEGDTFPDDGIGRYWISDDLLTGSVYDTLIPLYETMALQYKDNPYIWFNPINEPAAFSDGGGLIPNFPDVAFPRINKVYQLLIDAIRGQGNLNPIYLEATGWGQDGGSFIKRNVLNDNHYFINPKGFQALKGMLSGTSLQFLASCQSVYEQWLPVDMTTAIPQTEPPWTGRLPLYLDRVRELHNIPHMFVEFSNGNAGEDTTNASLFLEQLIKENQEYQEMGALLWHWDASTGDPTLRGTGNQYDEAYAASPTPNLRENTQGAGWAITFDQDNVPTNLTTIGQVLFNISEGVKTTVLVDTLSEARENINCRFIDNWTESTPYTLDNEVFDTKSNSEYVRLVTRNTFSEQWTHNSNSKRRFRREGLIMAQVFVPRGLGTNRADSLASKIRDIFEAEEFGEAPCITTYDAELRELGIVGKYYQINIDIRFEYFDIK